MYKSRFKYILANALIVALGFILTACQTTEDAAIGSGPLTLSPQTKINFDNYINMKYPVAFAVSPDGRNSGWFSCQKKGACFLEAAKYKAISYCNENTAPRIGPCKVYAAGKKVVWQGLRVNLAQLQTASMLQVDTSSIGSGPIFLNARVKNAFDDYLNFIDPIVFVVSPDGKHAGFRFCKQKGACSSIDYDYTRDAIANCNENTDPRTDSCKVYAFGKNIVWNKRLARAEGPLTLPQSPPPSLPLPQLQSPPPPPPLNSSSPANNRLPEKKVRYSKAFKDLEEEINKARKGR